MSDLAPHTFRAGFFFCGLGAGARGFIDALARLGADAARFINVGGIDNDPLACKDFEYLTGGKALLADMSTLTPAELRTFMGDTAPDTLFLSPPCKGFSRLLGAEAAEAEKYQKLNQLVLQGLFLACETWETPPTTIVLENVEGIRTRGKELLAKARQLLRSYGYLFHEQMHDCGEIGGLAQHRRRYLMVARLEPKLRAYIYRPPKRRVRGCGEVLETLPMPGDESAGRLHALPRISWLNWVRLALIPAGGDWRDLPGVVPEGKKRREVHRRHAVTKWDQPAATVTGPGGIAADNVADPRELGEALGVRGGTEEERRAWEQKGKKTPGQTSWFKGKYGVGDWDKPSRAVIGGPSNGASAIADPRVAEAVGLKQTAEGADSFKGRPGLMGVIDWQEPSPTVTGTATVSGSNGKAAVADPRPFGNVDRVTSWEEPVGTITSSPAPSSGGAAVADPRIPGVTPERELRRGDLGVNGWTDPTGTIIGESYPGNGAFSVADPRLAVHIGDPTRGGKLGVVEWEEPAPTITGSMEAARSNTPASVADPRIGLDHAPRNDSYGVTDWGDPAKAVRGNMTIRQGEASVADPRVPLGDGEGFSNILHVEGWEDPARTITGKPHRRRRPRGCDVLRDANDDLAGVAPGRAGYGGPPRGKESETSPARPGASSVADPRIPLSDRPNRHRNKYAVAKWTQPTGAVIGATRPGSGALSVADIRLRCAPRNGSYGVISWQEAVGTITGNARIDNGAFAVADKRRPKEIDVPIIIAVDGTWHRPLTTLEPAALQGIPAKVDGKPLQLAGRSNSKWRERIGNAVPVHAAQAIAESILTALLAGALGTWTLGSTGIWVRDDGKTEDEVNAEVDAMEAAA